MILKDVAPAGRVGIPRPPTVAGLLQTHIPGKLQDDGRASEQQAITGRRPEEKVVDCLSNTVNEVKGGGRTRTFTLGQDISRTILEFYERMAGVTSQDVSRSEQGYNFWSELAQKAKSVFLEDGIPVQPHDDSQRATEPLIDPEAEQVPVLKQTTPPPALKQNSMGRPLQKSLDAIASSLSLLGDTLGTAIEGVGACGRRVLPGAARDEGLQLMDTKSLRSPETKKSLQRSPSIWRKVENVRNCKHILKADNPNEFSRNDWETQLKASRDVAMCMSAKAKLLLRELAQERAEKAFLRERIEQLQEENRILRQDANQGDDDLVRAQLETLLAEKQRLAQENANYARENQFLHEVVEYHQLTLQDVALLDESLTGAVEDYSPRGHFHENYATRGSGGDRRRPWGVALVQFCLNPVSSLFAMAPWIGRDVMLGAAALASASLFLSKESPIVHAERTSLFGSIGRVPPASSPPPATAEVSSSSSDSKEAKARKDAPRTSEVGFDPEALERGARALREINASAHAKKVFELMKKQEETRQAEENAKRAEYQALQAQYEIERQKALFEEQKNLMQQQAQSKAQLARYEDELARKRMQAEHEALRVRNAELVKMQEESSARQEQVRRMTEEQIQEQRRQTERERAETERETIRVKAIAEAEGRVLEARNLEDVNRRLFIEKAAMEKDKWLAAIRATLDQVGGGFNALVTDKEKLLVLVGGATALAAGVYSSREGARTMWNYIGSILGQPALIRESSRSRFLSPRFRNRKSSFTNSAASSSGSGPSTEEKGLSDVVLHSSLHKRLEELAVSIANTKKHNAAFRNVMFYGPPGTGKTMVAKRLALQSGLDYAIMTGGDVAPLGPQAVTKLHELFDWAGRSKKGTLLFIDESDAFLSERNNRVMSEAQRSALNAFLYRTGDQSKNFLLVLATNRPGDLDAAVVDRIDEVMEFPVPSIQERLDLLKLYFNKYIVQTGVRSGWRSLFQGKEGDKIEASGITEEIFRLAASKIEGFSGREIAKLMASVQGAVYGSVSTVLTPEKFIEVVDYKIDEHERRLKLRAAAA
ncbi:hypothetical protein R1flu_007635 [Riccia fluitans]|uniref:AAA+ ATPase domain-containing protein n=1 Tax=Riccia fluitans TaxID=41844 RepID=A0ABD1YZZ2_9MARC